MMRRSPSPVMMRLGHRFTGGPPPREADAAFAARAPARPRPRSPLGRADAGRAPEEARDARSPTRPWALVDAGRREGRLGEFLR